MTTAPHAYMFIALAAINNLSPRRAAVLQRGGSIQLKHQGTMKLLKKYSSLKFFDGLMCFVSVALTITTIVFLFHCAWLDALLNALWAVIAWRNYQLNVKLTTAGEIIELQEQFIDNITDAIKEGAERGASLNKTDEP
jgi:hypothetical protein